MLRRLVRALRWFLLLVGISLVAWMPVSWFYRLQIASSWPFSQTYVVVQDLVIYVNIDRLTPWRVQQGASVRFEPIVARVFEQQLLPHYDAERDVDWTNDEFIVPIWLASALCLAWPVTSFIIARRRHKRGFPVEPAKSTPLPRAGEVPSESESEAERASIKPS